MYFNVKTNKEVGSENFKKSKKIIFLNAYSTRTPIDFFGLNYAAKFLDLFKDYFDNEEYSILSVSFKSTIKLKEVFIIYNKINELVKKYDVKGVFCIGEITWKCIFSTGFFERHIGKWIYISFIGCKVTPLYNPEKVFIHFKYNNFNSYKKSFINLKNTIYDKYYTEDVTRHVIENEKEYLNLIDKFTHSEYIVLDIETLGLEVVEDHNTKGLLLIGIMDYYTKDIYIIDGELIYNNKLVFEKICNNKKLILHNAVFDLGYLKKIGLNIVNIYVIDIYLLHNLIDENAVSKSLKYQSCIYTEYGGYELKLDLNRNEILRKNKLLKSEFRYNMFKRDLLIDYLEKDVHVTKLVYKVFEKYLSEDKEGKYINKLYDNITRKLINVIIDIHITGTPLNIKEIERNIPILDLKLEEEKKYLFNTLDIDALSHIQLKESLSKLLNKTVLSTEEKELKKIEDKHPIIPRILNYRKNYTELNTYLKSWNNLHRKSRLHSSYNIVGTVAGRMTSKNPNLQNITRGSFLRNMIEAKKGYKLIDADIKQAEIRWLAHYSNDKLLLDILKDKSLDIHTEITKTIFKIKDDDVNLKKYRYITKTIVFGLIYGRGVKSIGEALNVSMLDADKYIKSIYEKMPNVYLVRKGVEKRVINNEPIISYFGRLRHFPIYTSLEKRDKSKVLRQAFNSLIQGSSADYVSLSLINIHDYIVKNKMRSRIVLTVHDSVMVESPEEEVDVMYNIIGKYLTLKLPNVRVNFECDVNVLKRWE